MNLAPQRIRFQVERRSLRAELRRYLLVISQRYELASISGCKWGTGPAKRSEDSLNYTGQGLNATNPAVDSDGEKLHYQHKSSRVHLQPLTLFSRGSKCIHHQ